MSIATEVAEHNADSRVEGWTKIGFGAVISLVSFVMVWGIFQFFLLRMLGFRGWTASNIGLGLAVVYMAVVTWEAWRKVNPLSALTMDDVTRSRVNRNLPGMAGSVIGAFDRTRIAAFAWALIAGPANLLDAWAAFRRVYKVDEKLIGEAEALLDQCDAGLDPERIISPRAYFLLYSLKLVKCENSQDGEPQVVKTQRGKAMTLDLGDAGAIDTSGW